MRDMSPPEPISKPRSDAAGMTVPPPLLYAVPLIAGIIIGHWLPLLALPPTPLRVIGIIVIVVGLGFGGWARLLFLFRGTSPVPIKPSTVVVADGPFRISRNPFYVSFTAIYLGIALLCRSVWPLIFLPFLLIAIGKQIRREEAYLERRFGAEYLSYKSKVRRWL